MDLESTLIRAEVLFRKYQRLVEAIDKKGNFPGPRLSITGTPKKKEERVITPELRRLLSRDVEILPRKEVAKLGDGLAGYRAK